MEIRLLDSVAEFEAASRLVGHIWSDDDPKAPAALLRALAHAGNFVAGAFSDAELVGVSIGFFGQDGDHFHLHSHITGVDPRLQNKSLGFALKQFQRSWALARGTSSIRWTADPLVRRNLYFNLCKLGATIVDYYPDFYGPLLDGVNGDGASDRVLLHWDLASPRAVEAADQPPLEAVLRPGAVVVSPGSDGFPVASAVSRRHASRLDPRRHRQPPRAAIPVRRTRGAKRFGWRSAARSRTDTGARRSRATAGSS